MAFSPASLVSVLLANRYVVGFVYLTLISVIGIVTYALATGSEVAVSEKEWFAIRPASVKERDQMAKQIDDFKKNYVKKAEYESLQSRVKELERTTLNIALLPEEVKSDDPNNALQGIKRLVDQARDFERDVPLSVSFLTHYIAKRGAINTAPGANEEEQRNLHRHIQRCLAAINYFDKKVSGIPDETYRAILNFQRAHSLATDGVIGRKTWGKIQEIYIQLQDH